VARKNPQDHCALRSPEARFYNNNLPCLYIANARWSCLSCGLCSSPASLVVRTQKKRRSRFCGPAAGCRGRFANRSGQYLTACRDRSHVQQAPTSMLLMLVAAFRIPREARSTRTVGNRSGIPVGARFIRDLQPNISRASGLPAAAQSFDAICADGWPARDTKQPSCAERSLDARGLVRAVGRQVGTIVVTAFPAASVTITSIAGCNEVLPCRSHGESKRWCVGRADMRNRRNLHPPSAISSVF